MEFIAKDGFPVERIQGRWFTNFIRLLLHTRKIIRGQYKQATTCPGVDCCQEPRKDTDNAETH